MGISAHMGKNEKSTLPTRPEKGQRGEMTAQHHEARILVRDEDMVQWLAFDNPDRRNALTYGMVEDALGAVRDFGSDGNSRVLVIAGGGDRAFVSGADISELERRSESADALRRYVAMTTELVDEIRGLAKPTIAMIGGYCFGAGVGLAAACDLRYASDDAVLSIPAAKLGVAYEMSFAEAVVEVVGPSATKEMLFTGRRYDAPEIAHMGFANRIHPRATLLREVTETANEIARNAPLSVRAAKRTVAYLLSGRDERDRLECEALIATCENSADFAEGRAAFAAKRQPVFKGA